MGGAAFESEIVSPVLHFGMLADRTQAVLQQLELGASLGDRERKALGNADSFLEQAAKGGDVIKKRSMKGFTYEAMSAYESTRASGARDDHNEDNVLQLIQRLRDMIQKALKDELTKKEFDELIRFFKCVVRWSLGESGSAVERVATTR